MTEPVCLYIRGAPGTGKHTVAGILEKRLGWKLFWIHALDGIVEILGNGRDGKLARLMDEISIKVLYELCKYQASLIYVRPSRDLETVERTRRYVKAFGYKCVVVTLTASYATMCSRVESRPESKTRISKWTELDEYLRSRDAPDMLQDHVIATDDRTPEEIADLIERLL